jgi:serine/threonine protein kinase
MSPESIGQQVYSKKSDVWMFGIVVYEIVSQCEPHCDRDPLEVSTQIRLIFSENCYFEIFSFSFFIWQTSHFRFLIFEYRDKGLTPEIPSNCPQKLVEFMQMCWKIQPQQRPLSFSLLFCLLILHLTNISTTNNFFLRSNMNRILKRFVNFYKNKRNRILHNS